MDIADLDDFSPENLDRLLAACSAASQAMRKEHPEYSKFWKEWFALSEIDRGTKKLRPPKGLQRVLQTLVGALLDEFTKVLSDETLDEEGRALFEGLVRAFDVGRIPNSPGGKTKNSRGANTASLFDRVERFVARIEKLGHALGENIDDAQAAKISVHVTPHGDGWAVKREGARRASSVHSTKAGAELAARKEAKSIGADMYIHRRDGTIGTKGGFEADARFTKKRRK